MMVFKDFQHAYNVGYDNPIKLADDEREIFDMKMTYAFRCGQTDYQCDRARNKDFKFTDYDIPGTFEKVR